MKSIALICKPILLLILLSATTACIKEECLDLEKLESLQQEMEEWYVDTTQTTFTLVDRNGIQESMWLSSHHYHYEPHTIEDDCGVIYGSYNFSVQYNTSLYPVHFAVDIRGGGGDDEFVIEVQYNRPAEQFISKKAIYNLNTDASVDHAADISFLQELKIQDTFYKEVLEITFSTAEGPNEVEVVWFAKKFGIVGYKTKNGNQFGRL